MGTKREADVRRSSSSKAPRYEHSRDHESRSSRDGNRRRDSRSNKESLAVVKTSQETVEHVAILVAEKSGNQEETTEHQREGGRGDTVEEQNDESLCKDTGDASVPVVEQDLTVAQVKAVEEVEPVQEVEPAGAQAGEIQVEGRAAEDVPHTPEVSDVKCSSPCGHCRVVDEFEKLGRLGEGSYGVVYKAKDKRTEEVVALKKIKMHNQETEGFPVSSLREINLLISLRHPSIVDVREVVIGGDMDSIYMVMEYIENNLKDALSKSKEPFDHSRVKRMMHQLIDAVAYLHDNWVLHRDIKPSNILLTGDTEVKICDFGLARRYDSPIKVYTYNVVTMWYRAPELLLGKAEDNIKYSTGIDVWSLGCIMAELILKEPLFAGQSEIDQLRRIKKVVSTAHLEKPGIIFPSNKLSSLRDRILYPAAQEGRAMLSETGLDLLSRMLAYDPDKRITAREALNHPWFEEVP